MIAVKILLRTGCALLAIPMLYIIGSIAEDIILTWKRASWGSRMEGMFVAGCFFVLCWLWVPGALSEGLRSGVTLVLLQTPMNKFPLRVENYNP